LPALWQHTGAVIVFRDIALRLRAVLGAVPDQAVVRARNASERLVASVRLTIILIIVILNLATLGFGGDPEFVLPVSAVGLTYGIGLFVLPRKASAPWVPWVASVVDVTLATLIIGSFVVYGFPLAAVNNRVMYDWYFVAVTLAAIRFDWRLCAFTTVLALAEFLGLSAYVALHWNLRTLTSVHHGAFVPSQFVGRLLMLSAHGTGTIAVALWARHLRMMVGTDQLTGLLQRRPFFERIEEELARADVSRTQLSIAIFDVDEFKRFNDRFGHLEGDRVLQLIAEQLRKGVRTTDLVARYGGEEFVIAFPRLDVQLALRRAEALREEIASRAIGLDGIALTISGGVASWPTDGQDFEQVLRRADERLYGAKAAGRNLILGPRPVPIRVESTQGV
jgi:diguanylate cyclase (GGDEF)-like protein